MLRFSAVPTVSMATHVLVHRIHAVRVCVLVVPAAASNTETLANLMREGTRSSATVVQATLVSGFTGFLLN
jgi:hypothetical protein